MRLIIAFGRAGPGTAAACASGKISGTTSDAFAGGAPEPSPRRRKFLR